MCNDIELEGYLPSRFLSKEHGLLAAPMAAEENGQPVVELVMALHVGVDSVVVEKCDNRGQHLKYRNKKYIF